MVHNHLREKGVQLLLSSGVTAFSKEDSHIIVSTTTGESVACDMVLLAAGVRAESQLAKKAGLAVNDRGGIVVNDALQTSDPCIYAVGDAVSTRDFLTGANTITTSWHRACGSWRS